MSVILDPKTFVYDPQTTADLTIQSLTEAQKEGNTSYHKTGIPQMDDHYVMHRPSKVNGVIADTSNGKTAIMNYMARNLLSLNTKDGVVSQLKEGEIVVYCTWEDSVEDLSMSFLANSSLIPITSLYNGEMGPEEWEKIINAAALRAETPLWLVGHSDMNEKRRPRLTMTDIWHAVDYIENTFGLKVRAMFMDYLQRVNRADMRGDMREQFMGIMDSSKDLALAYSTDLTIGSQIGRDIQARKWQQPQIHDAQETSNFEQTCDGMISAWIPKKTKKMGESLTPKEGDNPGIWVTENLMILETLKQKKGKAPVTRAVDYYAQTNSFGTYTPPKFVK